MSHKRFRIRSRQHAQALHDDLETRRHLLRETFGIDAVHAVPYDAALEEINIILERDDAIFPQTIEARLSTLLALEDSDEHLEDGTPQRAIPSGECPLCRSEIFDGPVSRRVTVVTLLEPHDDTRPIETYVLAGAVTTDEAIPLVAEKRGETARQLEKRYRVWVHPSTLLDA